jgi:hypothetical protein
MLGRHLSVQKLPVCPLEALHDTITQVIEHGAGKHRGLRPFSAGS